MLELLKILAGRDQIVGLIAIVALLIVYGIIQKRKKNGIKKEPNTFDLILAELQSLNNNHFSEVSKAIERMEEKLDKIIVILVRLEERMRKK